MHKKIIYILLFLVIMSSAFAAIGKIFSPEPNEIKDQQISQSFELNHAQRLRFDYDGIEINIRVRQMDLEQASFSIYSGGYDYNQQIVLKKFDKFAFDVNNDNTIDFSFSLENITITTSKKRVNITFTTDNFAVAPEFPQEETEEQEEEVVVEIEEPIIEEEVEEEEFVPINTYTEERQSQATAIDSSTFNQVATVIVLLLIVLFVAGLYFLNKHKEKLF